MTKDDAVSLLWVLALMAVSGFLVAVTACPGFTTNPCFQGG